VLTALSLGCLGVMLSVYVQRSLAAILLTYVLAALYLTVTTILYAYGLQPPAPFDAVLNSGNVLLLIWEVQRGTTAPAMATGLPTLLLDYALFHLTVVVLCLTVAVLPLRAWFKAVSARGRRRAYVVGLSQRRKRLPVVGGNPMLWKELHAEPAFRFNRTLM